MYTNTEKHAEYDYSLAIKNRGRPSNRGDGKFTRLAKANQCGNQNFSKRCPKRPERVRRHWQNSGPSEPTPNTSAAN